MLGCYEHIRDNKDGSVLIDMLSIGIKFKEYMLVSCRDQSSYRVLPKACYLALPKQQQEIHFLEKIVLYSTTVEQIWANSK